MKRSSQHILDEWLVTCSQSGDRQALNRLLQRWRPKLIVFAERQLGEKEGAYDVVQECLIAVAKDLHKLKDPVAFPKWVYQILQRRVCDWIQTQQRQRRNDLALTEEHRYYKDKRADSALQYGLRNLDRDHYLTVYFFYLEEFSLHEISVIMDVPVGTVKSRLFKARQQLKNLLEGDRHE